MRKRLEPNAPRFHALWQHSEGRTILIMRRSDWDSLNVGVDKVDKMVVLSKEVVSEMPFGGVAFHPAFEAAVALKDLERVKISIYRRGP